MNEEQKKELAKITQNSSKIYWNEEMKKHTTFKIGGLAECLIVVNNIKTLKEILRYSKEQQIPINIIGNGSNVLVLDGGIKGITIKIDIQKLEIKSNSIKIGAGNKIAQIAYIAKEEGLTGMEELAGIPGTIGGAVYMNAGANGKEIKDIVTKIKYLDENYEEKEMTNKQAKFTYRHSIFAEKEYIILEIEIKLQNGAKEKIEEKMEQYAKSRKKKQPLEYPNAGSTFKRGDGFITAKLIDECGLKGYKIGGAEISTKHAGFIINKGDATAQDVLSLVKYVQDKVKEKFNKQIQLEMKIIGKSEEVEK